MKWLILILIFTVSLLAATFAVYFFYGIVLFYLDVWGKNKIVASVLVAFSLLLTALFYRWIGTQDGASP